MGSTQAFALTWLNQQYRALPVGVHSTVVERVTYMRVYAGSSPTNADHRNELI